jgi:DNA-binding Lrp family transcriptional regulator
MKPFIRLNDNERLFIAITAMDAAASAKKIAQQLGIREHTVRHIRDSLLQREVITPIYMIDTYRLGFTDFRVFLSDIAEPTRVRTSFEKRVLQHHQAYWVARLNGAHQYGITFLAKDPCEMIDFFAAVQPHPDGLYANKTISIAGDWTVFPPSYLAPELRVRDSITTTSRVRIPPLEHQDISILEAMARNPSANIATLARKTGMAATSLTYRVDKLTEMQVIRGQTYLLNCPSLGISVYRIMVVEKGLSLPERERLRKYFYQHPNVCALLACTGGWDYELRFECANPESVEEFSQTIVDNFGAGIGSIQVSQQIKILKRISYPCAAKP